MLKSHPRIFYCPAVHTDATRKLVDETHKLLDGECGNILVLSIRFGLVHGNNDMMCDDIVL